MNNSFLLVFSLFLFTLLSWPNKGNAQPVEIDNTWQIKAVSELPEKAPEIIRGENIQQSIPITDELKHNPFLTQEEENELADSSKLVPLDYLNLSAILYSPDNQSKAIINGRILTAGDALDNKKISEIQPEAVILKDENTEYIIKLKG